MIFHFILYSADKISSFEWNRDLFHQTWHCIAIEFWDVNISIKKAMSQRPLMSIISTKNGQWKLREPDFCVTLAIFVIGLWIKLRYKSHRFVYHTTMLLFVMQGHIFYWIGRVIWTGTLQVHTRKISDGIWTSNSTTKELLAWSSLVVLVQLQVLTAQVIIFFILREHR